MFTLDSKANSRITEDAGTLSQRFVFPLSIDPHIRYQSIQAIREYLRKEEERSEDVSVRNLFNGCCKPNQQECKYIRMRCRCCPAHLNFKKEDDMFVLSMWNNIHEHQTKLTTSKIDASIFEIFREKARMKLNLGKLKDMILKKYAISKSHFEILLRRFDEEELTNFNYMQSVLNDAGMVSEYDWGTNLKQRYPRLLVTATAAMKRNYLKYGDMLSFDFTDNSIRNITTDGKKYRLGVFSVIDTNMRVLLVAVVLMSDPSIQQIQAAFEMFFKLYPQAPQPLTVQTSPDPDIYQAIIRLQEHKTLRSYHIFDPHYIVDHIQRKLNGEPEENNLKGDDKNKPGVKNKLNNDIEKNKPIGDPQKNKIAMKAFIKMIRVRTEKEFADCLMDMKMHCQDLDPFLRWLAPDMMMRYVYCMMSTTFIGIRRFPNERAKIMVEEEIAYEANLNTVIDRMIGLDKRLDAKSSDGYRIYSESIEYQLADQRIKCVRIAFESKVFERFLENYFKCLAEARLVEEEEDLNLKDGIFHIRNKVTGEVFKVTNWVCQCDQVIKTGVPCPHVLEVARRTKDMSFVPLFNKRWLKELPQQETQKVMWIKRGRAKSSRRNTHKKRIGAGGTGAIM